MALGTFAQLKTALETWLERAGDAAITANAADCVTLAEARMNRDLIGLRMTTVNDATLTGTIGSRQLSLPTNYLAPVALWLTTDGGMEEMIPLIIGNQSLSTTNGDPVAWGINADKIDLNCPCNAAHTFLFRYHKKLDIAADTTNWLLTNYPDVYLYACLTEAAILLQDVQSASGYEVIYNQRKDQIKVAESANKRRALLRVDPALGSMNQRDAGFAGFALGGGFDSGFG